MKKKAKPKSKSKTKDIELDYIRHPILSATATEFRFKGPSGLSVIAVMMPSVGTVVFGLNPGIPSRCWTYPAGTSMKLAVSKTFRGILETACQQMKVEKKA